MRRYIARTTPDEIYRYFPRDVTHEESQAWLERWVKRMRLKHEFKFGTKVRPRIDVFSEDEIERNRIKLGGKIYFVPVVYK